MEVKCEFCYFCFEIPSETTPEEIFTCPSCGEEFQIKQGILVSLELEGEDWGE